MTTIAHLHSILAGTLPTSHQNHLPLFRLTPPFHKHLLQEEPNSSQSPKLTQILYPN